MCVRRIALATRLYHKLGFLIFPDIRLSGKREKIRKFPGIYEILTGPQEFWEILGIN